MEIRIPRGDSYEYIYELPNELKFSNGDTIYFTVKKHKNDNLKILESDGVDEKLCVERYKALTEKIDTELAKAGLK